MGAAGGGNGAAKKQEALRLTGQQRNLQRSYGNQALILKMGAAGGRAGAAQEARSHLPGVGQQGGLGIAIDWGLLARAQGDSKTEKEKLEQALAIFTELKMPRERDAVQKELDKLGDGG